MLERMGISQGSAPDPAEAARRAMAGRVFDDLDPWLEAMVQRMIGILLIEISAHHTFAWAEELLSDTELVAGDGEPAQLVSYIRQDEQPHVDYLRTALTEMRDRTFVGESGRRLPGSKVIGTLWERGLADSLGPRRAANQDVARREIADALDGHPRGRDILARFEELGAGA
jgi:hypothetical protein